MSYDRGREEWDWALMREQEDEYFEAKRQPEPLSGADLVAIFLKRQDLFMKGEVEPAVAALRALPYPEYLKTDHWKETRRKAMHRDGHQCRICASMRELQVHHLTYENLGDEKTADLLTLCRRCHELQHNL